MLRSLSGFYRAQSGAVTTDWVVLAAAVVGLGVTSANVVRSGSQSLAADIEGALSQAAVAGICQDSYAFRVFTDENASKADDIANEISRQDDVQLVQSHREVAAKVETLIAERADQASIDENMDYLALYQAEVERRGLRPDERTPTVDALAGVTGACGDNTGAVGAGQHTMAYYNDPRLDEDYQNYLREFAAADNDTLANWIVKIDDEFHQAVANGNATDAAKLLDLSWMLASEAGTRDEQRLGQDALNRYERALQVYQEARL